MLAACRGSKHVVLLIHEVHEVFFQADIDLGNGALQHFAKFQMRMQNQGNVSPKESQAAYGAIPLLLLSSALQLRHFS